MALGSWLEEGVWCLANALQTQQQRQLTYGCLSKVKAAKGTFRTSKFAGFDPFFEGGFDSVFVDEAEVLPLLLKLSFDPLIDRLAAFVFVFQRGFDEGQVFFNSDCFHVEWFEWFGWFCSDKSRYLENMFSNFFDGLEQFIVYLWLNGLVEKLRSTR